MFRNRGGGGWYMESPPPWNKLDPVWKMLDPSPPPLMEPWKIKVSLNWPLCKISWGLKTKKNNVKSFLSVGPGPPWWNFLDSHMSPTIISKVYLLLQPLSNLYGFTLCCSLTPTCMYSFHYGFTLCCSPTLVSFCISALTAMMFFSCTPDTDIWDFT